MTFALVYGIVHFMDMRKRIPITTTYDPEFVEELDEWLASRPYKTPRASFLEAAGKKLLAEEKAKDETPKKPKK